LSFRQSGRLISTGSPEWRLHPNRQWEDSAIKSSGVFHPSERISSAAKPSLVTLLHCGTFRITIIRARGAPSHGFIGHPMR
jgi:hypothetical protein